MRFAAGATRGSRGLGSSHPPFVPELEHQERPEGLAMVADPRLMLADSPRYLFGPEQSLPLEPAGLEHSLEERGERPAEPAGHRDAEPLLGPLQDRPWEPTRGRGLEQPFGLFPPVLELGGKPLDHL